MEIVFLAKGHCQLGMRRQDKNGNVVESKPATFTFADDGPCVAVGTLNSETMEQVGDVSLHGDYDAAGFLGAALEKLPKCRTNNIPNLKQIVKAMGRDNVNICDYCSDQKCFNCILKEYKEEDEDE